MSRGAPAWSVHSRVRFRTVQPTDPPCNVRVEPRSHTAPAAGLSSFVGTLPPPGRASQERPRRSKKLRARDRPLVNDFVSAATFAGLLHAWFSNLARVLEPGRAFYIWGGSANCGSYPPVLQAVGLHFPRRASGSRNSRS
jgi:hypothetical protein